jgi:hypothetical protein
MTYDPIEAERLVAETREDDQRVAKAPWHTEMPGGVMGGRMMLSGSGRDTAIVPMANAEIQGAIARLRNNAKALADQLEAAAQIVNAAIEWRDAQCDRPHTCGDGGHYHDRVCPTIESQRVLVNAIDEMRGAK